MRDLWLLNNGVTLTSLRESRPASDCKPKQICRIPIFRTRQERKTVDPNSKFLNRQGAKDAKFIRVQNMTTHPNATAPGGVLGLRLWTQPLEALATRGGVLAVGR